MKVLFFRCPYGHYFRTALCPFDATEAPDVREVVKMLEARQELTIEDLKAQGLKDSILSRIVLIDSEVDEMHCEAFKVASIVVDGVLFALDVYGRKEE